jgi:hypothetical protein
MWQAKDSAYRIYRNLNTKAVLLCISAFVYDNFRKMGCSPRRESWTMCCSPWGTAGECGASFGRDFSRYIVNVYRVMQKSRPAMLSRSSFPGCGYTYVVFYNEIIACEAVTYPRACV